MSSYGLIKATSRAMRVDSIADLHIVNQWRYGKGLEAVVPRKPSVRQIENAVALGIENLDITDLPKLVRSAEFYLSIIPEITDKERGKKK
jgi:hypothetical protein